MSVLHRVRPRDEVPNLEVPTKEVNAMDNVSSVLDGSIAVVGTIAGVIAGISALMASEPPTRFDVALKAVSGAGHLRTTLNRAA